MSPAPGQLVNDKVRLVHLLGRGGMGSVWAARHEGLDLDVAVKFIAPELLHADPALVLTRFRREAQLAAKLDNANTVRVLDHGVAADGAPYIVMELLRGRSLAERLQADGRVPLEEAVQIVRDVASGLEHAHALGIVHRDIKPPNIFLARTRDERPVTKILDFGIAKSQSVSEPTGAGTGSGVLIGTPHYMSPEQLMRAGPPDKSADVWALAVVAYEVLVGRPPFHGETLAATLVAITQAAMSKPTTVVPSLAPALDDFFGRALSADPARRFGSAAELAAAFAEAARGTPAAEHPTLAQPRAELAADPALPTAEFLRLTTGSGPPSPGRDTEIAHAPTEQMRAGVTELGAATAPASRSAKRVPWALVAAAAVAAGALGLYVTWGSASLPPPPPQVAELPSSAPQPSLATTAPLPSAEPAASSSAPALPELLDTLVSTAVPKGFAPLSSVFVPAFEVSREAGDEGATFAAALRRCERRRLSLCTEAQWQRACERVPLLGSRPSWTLTPDEEGVAIRGGAGGCAARAVGAADGADPARVGACCTRSIGVTSTNGSEEFLLTTSSKLLNVERLINAANGSGLADLSAINTNAFGKIYDRPGLAEMVRWLGQNSAFYFDSCTVAIQDSGKLRMWAADCSGVLFDKRKSRAVGASRWLTFGDGGLIEEIREPKARTELSPPEGKK